ncbi:MAG: hypothetical protein IKZ13_08950 [Akkermansia sp.]|nr:hypothetical protein [Akkermansia sp.]
MKLHLPKSLLCAVMAVYTVTSAFAGWDSTYSDTFYYTGSETSLNTADSTSDNTTLFLKPQGATTGTIGTVNIANGDKLVVTGIWNKTAADQNFSSLTLTTVKANGATDKDNNCTLEIAGNQGAANGTSQTVLLGNTQYSVKNTIINKGGTLVFGNANDIIHYGLPDMKFVIAGTLDLQGGRQTLGDRFCIELDGGKIVGTNTKNTGSTGGDKLGALDFYGSGSTIKSKGESSIVGGIRLRKNIGIEVATEGVLTVDSIVQNGGNRNINLSGGGKLVLTLANIYEDSLYAGFTVLSNGSTISYANTNTATYNGTISGTGNVEMTGSGSMTVAKVESLAGDIMVSNGTLSISSMNVKDTVGVNVKNGTLEISSVVVDWNNHNLERVSENLHYSNDGTSFTTNGFRLDRSTYRLFDGYVWNGSVAGFQVDSLEGDTVVTCIEEMGTIYVVNEGTHTISTAGDYINSTATQYHVNSGATLVIDGNQSTEMTAASILLSTTGDGTKKLTTSTEITDSKGVNLGKLELSTPTTAAQNTALTIFYDSGAKTTTIESLKVDGSVEIGTKRSSSCHNGTIEINNLSSTGSSASLTLVNGSQTSAVTTYNLNSGSFDGTINIKGNSAASGTATRPVHLNLMSESVAKNAVINFLDADYGTGTELTNNKKANYITLGVGSSTVKVAGLSGITTNEVVVTGVGEGARTLEINVAENESFTTNAKFSVSNNTGVTLKKTGKGTQEFTGSEYGAVILSGGELRFNRAGGSSMSIGNITMNADNTKLTFAASGDGLATFDVGSISATTATNTNHFNREIFVGANTKVTVDSISNNWGLGAIEVDGLLNVEGNFEYTSGTRGNIKNANVINGSGSVTTGSFEVKNEGDVTLDVANFTSGSTTIQNGRTLTVGSNNTDLGVLSIEGGSKLNGTGIVTADSLSVENGTVSVANFSTGTTTITGNLIVNGGNAQLGVLSAAGKSLTANAGNIELLANATHTLGTLDASNNGGAMGQVTLKQGAQLTVNTIWGANGSSINLESGATLNSGVVSITTNVEGKNAVIKASENAQYSLSNGDNGRKGDKYTISNAAVTVTSASNVDINNTLSNSSLKNAGTGKLNIINSSDTLTELSATGGDITVAGKVTMIDGTQSLATIAGATISKSEISSGVAGTLNIKGGVVDNALISLMEGASLKLENVTLGAGTQISGAAAIATVDADGSVSSTGNALTLADTTVQIANSSTEVLSNPLSSEMALALDLSTDVKGIAVTASTFANVSLTGEMELNITGDLISELIQGDYKYVAITFEPSVAWSTDTVTITGASFGNGQPAGGVVIDNGTIYVSVPEPTTATLSLLALAALAARRRRK